MLTVEIARFHHVIVKDRQGADSLSSQRGRDVADQATRANAEYLA